MSAPAPTSHPLLAPVCITHMLPVPVPISHPLPVPAPPPVQPLPKFDLLVVPGLTVAYESWGLLIFDEERYGGPGCAAAM